MKHDLGLIAERLKNAHRKSEYSINEIAEACGVARQTVINWEKGKAFPNISHLKELCRLYGCDIGYLFCEYEERTLATHFMHEKTGLSEGACVRLNQYHNFSVTDDPALCQYGQQYLDLFSAFVCDYGILGMSQASIPKILEIKEYGLSEKDEVVFQDEAEAISFYTYQMQSVIMRFLTRYFENEKLYTVDTEG